MQGLTFNVMLQSTYTQPIKKLFIPYISINTYLLSTHASGTAAVFLPRKPLEDCRQRVDCNILTYISAF